MSRGACITLCTVFGIANGVFTHLARAQAPLSIEQLIVDASRWQFTAGFDEQSAHQPVGEVRDLGLRASLRYGITPRLEVNASFSHRGLVRRLPGDYGEDRTNVLSIGSNWLVHPEDRWPALLIELRWDEYLPSGSDTERSRGGALAATVYRSIDPVVLSLRATLNHRSAFAADEREIDPGTSWRIEPLVNFAVNPRVTLVTGLTFVRDAATRVDGTRILAPRHDLGLRLGLGFAPRPGSNVVLSGDMSSTTVGVALEWFIEL